MKKKILILYTEYAPYLHASLNKLTQLFNYEVHIVRYPLDPNAPFTFTDSAEIKFYEFNSLTRKTLYELYQELDPVCVITAGWSNKDYNSILPKIKRNGTLVIGIMDNQWTGSLKQRVFIYAGKYFLNRMFSYLWVPGLFQFEYLRRVGYDGRKIMTGYYCADTDLFLEKYSAKESVPKRFIYVGRLLDIKGTPTLVKAIELLYAKEKCDWEFLVIGNGHYESAIKALSDKYRNVIHKPFMQPAELAKATADGGVFVLPSNYDAWGVVVHEYALLGFPLILSSMVGSRNYFVSPGYNGFIFDAEDPQSLCNTFKKMIQLGTEDLRKMSERSNLIGRTMTTEAWACRLNDIIERNNSK